MAKRLYWTKYSPSVPLAIVTTLIFAALTLFHAFRLFRVRTWFCIPILVGGLFEIIGFACRAIGHYNQYIIVPYIIQALLILLAPILFAASVYMILNRLIQATGGESYSIIRATWVTKIFVGGDVLCFLVQMVGAAFLASANGKSGKDRGEMIILIGLILQIVIFSFFLVVSVIFHRRMLAASTSKSQTTKVNWKRFMLELYIVSVLITLRNLFRVIEYAQGEKGYLLSIEWPIYALDALPMAVVMAVCTQWHVGRLEATSDGEVELDQRAASVISAK